MRISNKLISPALCGLGFFLGSLGLRADDLTLSGGNARLTGTVRSINEAGVLELSTELSTEPLLLKNGAVDKVAFTSSAEPKDAPSALVELANGDFLPVEIESLDGERLIATSPDAGRMEIPRAAISSLQMGVERRKVIYSGPRNPDEWSGAKDFKKWTFANNSLVADGSAMATKKLALPEKFVLRFTLVWQAKQTPNFQMFFADPLLGRGDPVDRYYLQFGGAGLEIKRESSKGKRYNTVILLNRTPNQYVGRELQVEIRVDRKASRLVLFLNGEPEGEFFDPIPSIPTGSGLMMISNTPNGMRQDVRDIEVLELDDSRGRHFAEDRGDPTMDSLISREDDRWSGSLMDIRKETGNLLFRFKGNHKENPEEIPELEISTVFFAKKEGVAGDAKASPFILRLHGKGSLNVASCRFTEQEVTAVHPLLGELRFRRDGILAMEKMDAKPADLPEP